MSEYKITDEQKNLLLQISAQTLPDNPSRDGYSAQQIRGRLYKPYSMLVDLINGVFGTASSDVTALQTDFQSGDFAARAIALWSEDYTYDNGDITFYNIGTYGAFVQSLQAGNTNHEPYTDGVLNSTWWKEVVNFNNISESYFQEIQNAVSTAQGYADAASDSAEAAADSAEESASNATNAHNFSLNAQNSAEEAATKAAAASSSEANASGAAFAAQGFSQSASESAGNASNSAQAAANSATAAQGYAQQAQQYAQKHYQIVASVSALPRPGDSAYIYLVPTNSGTAQDSYSEYLWISESNDYEFIGTTADIDLSNYAQINGTYTGMTVGNATNAVSAQTATKATQDASGNVITATYATKTENNAKYTKPSTGIPESDLSADVQTSLSKADTALQSVPLATSSAVGGVKPVAKTDDMTQSVGVDANGALFTAPSGGGSIEYMTDDEVDALFN